MANFEPGYISDLSGVKDNIILRVRVLSSWMQPAFGNKNVNNMELIITDEHNSRMQVTIRSPIIKKFKHLVAVGNAVTIQRYTIGVIQPNYRMVNNEFRLSFLTHTDVEICNDFKGTKHGFVFRSFNTITSLKQEEHSQFDVIGHVVACEDLDNYDKHGKAWKKKPLTLVDAEGNELRCTLWSAFAQQFSDFLGTCTDHEKIVMVLQLGMMKIWDDKLSNVF